MDTHITSAVKTLLPWADKTFRDNPYPWYDVVRRDAPVYLDPLCPNTYIVSRYDDVVKFGKLPSLSIVDPEWVPHGPWACLKHTVIALDPPQHTALRRRSNKWFSPKLVKTWSEASTNAVNSALDELGPAGLIDGHRELAIVPAHVGMCAALGLPTDGVDPVMDAMYDTMVALGSVPTEEELKRAEEAFSYLFDRVRHYVRLQRQNPTPGMTASWLEEVDRGDMSEDEVVESLVLFWASGAPNPAYLIAGGLEIFARHPDIFELYKNAPEKRANILTEISRLYTPEISFTRYTTEAVEIQGITIPPKARIRFMIASANRDPAAFPNPHAMDVNRPPAATYNLTFGIGTHSCAGMLITRAEAEAVYCALAARVKRIELAGEPVYAHTDRAAGYARLPLKLII